MTPPSPLPAASPAGASAGFAPFDPEYLARLATELFRGDEVQPTAPDPDPEPWGPSGLVAPAADPWQLAPGSLPNAPADPGLGQAGAAAPTGAPQAPGSGFYFLDQGDSPNPEGPYQAAPAASPQAPGFYFLEPEPTAPPTEPMLAPEQPGQVALAESRAAAPPPVAGTPEIHEIRPEVVPQLDPGPGPFDAAILRRDFPILREKVNGKPLIWLDNAATTQKPNAVIDRISDFYRRENSNIHRAAHALAARATDAFEAAREKTRRFLNAPSVNEIVFVRGATEAINLVAKSWGRRNIGKDDEIVITWLEHHSNIVPWQQLAAEVGAKLRIAPVDDHGQIILEAYEKLLNPRTRLVSLTQVSNALGTVTPAKQMVAMAHRHGARVLVDGAQAVSHMRVDVQDLEADFYVFSGHKVFGPTGIGVLFGRYEILKDMPPWQGGGNMIADVTFERTVYQPAPARFEAGTGSIADAVGLGAALDYLTRIGMDLIDRHEHELLVYATQGLLTIPGLRLIGSAPEKAGLLSFVLDGLVPEEVGAALDREGIAVRSGHHCAQPALRRFGVESSVRPSLALYNTHSDIDALVTAVRNLKSR